MTRALAERMPGRVPAVIAVDAEQGWLLMRDFGAAELGNQDQSLWHEGLIAHAGIQQSWLGRTEELIALGLPVRSITELALQVEQLTEDRTLMDRLSADVRAAWLAAAPEWRSHAGDLRRSDQARPWSTVTFIHGTSRTDQASLALRLDGCRRVAPVR